METYQKTSGTGILLIAMLCLGLAGCAKKEAAPENVAPPTANEPVANRGTFEQDSCSEGQRVAVPSDAAFALYFDSSGNELETSSAESLAGTAGKTMCPFPSVSELDPGVCGTQCAKVMGRKTYCYPPPCT